jgi:hypothetical protein
LVFGSSHGVRLRFVDGDVSECFVGSIFKGHMTFEDGTDKEFQNVIASQHKPQSLENPENQDISSLT